MERLSSCRLLVRGRARTGLLGDGCARHFALDGLDYRVEKHYESDIPVAVCYQKHVAYGDVEVMTGSKTLAQMYIINFQEVAGAQSATVYNLASKGLTFAEPCNDVNFRVVCCNEVQLVGKGLEVFTLDCTEPSYGVAPQSRW